MRRKLAERAAGMAGRAPRAKEGYPERCSVHLPVQPVADANVVGRGVGGRVDARNWFRMQQYCLVWACANAAAVRYWMHSRRSEAASAVRAAAWLRPLLRTAVRFAKTTTSPAARAAWAEESEPCPCREDPRTATPCCRRGRARAAAIRASAGDPCLRSLLRCPE